MKSSAGCGAAVLRLWALAVLVLASSMPARAVCTDGASVAVRDAVAIDARTLRLRDGSELRLAGVESLWPASDSRAVATLADLVRGRELTIHDATKPDRYGRRVVFAVVSGHQELLQGMLLEQGVVVAAGTAIPPDCANYLTKRENVARAAKRGAWAESDDIKSAEMLGDILAQVGRFAVVQGKVISVRESGATIYVNFGRRWTRDFALTVSKRLVRDFEAAGIKLKSLESRIVRVRGFVEQRGGPRIQAFASGQIEVVGDR